MSIDYLMATMVSESQTHAMNNTSISCGTPLWAIDNPYLSILAPRFFSGPASQNWSDLPKRVGRLFLEAEKKYSPDHIALQSANAVADLVREGAFIPNSPVMMNSESEGRHNLFACHVLAPPEDPSDCSIARQIHDGCGGIGYDFTKMNDPVSATRGIELQTARLNLNRKRKAHSAVTLQYDHHEILKFIDLSPELTITHTNVEVDDVFFASVLKNDSAALMLWDKICTSIYHTGRPALSFKSEKAKRSSTPLINNVCGESLLRENESALIGSLNLTRFVVNGEFDFVRFSAAARVGLHCLDNLHDIQDHASETIRIRCHESRKVGVGVMGFADALLLMGLRYGSSESLIFVEKLMYKLRTTLINESEKMGEMRGACNTDLLVKNVNPRRNASLMAIPANGTLSLLANVTGGIEPMFSLLTKQKVDGTDVYQLQPTFKRLLEEKCVDSQRVFNQLMAGKKIHEIKECPSCERNNLVTANELSAREHIQVQATFQKYVDGGISKTINLPESSSIDDIKTAILFAWKSGCVGLSLYRNGSLQDQPTQSVA